MTAAPHEPTPPAVHAHIRRERARLLKHYCQLTDRPMTVLAFVWLALLILELTRGLGPALTTAGVVIWVVFVLDFAIGFVLAPAKTRYLRRNWLTAASLILPALRAFRVIQAVRAVRIVTAARPARLLRVLSSLNRGMAALGRTLARRGIGYVAALTVIVTLGGAAGMAYFERPVAAGTAGIHGYGDAVWWTAMMMTTFGSDYWPHTVEGRVLCWLLSVYALSVFGYITASLATHLIGTDARARVAVNRSAADRSTPV